MNTLLDYGQLYQKLALELRKERWFDAHWRTAEGLFPNATAPKSAFIQVYRDSWFNDEGRGIHFESWVTNADVTRRSASIVLHVESSREGTGINGKTFVRTLLSSVGERIAGWEGYQTKESYTMQPFIRKVAVGPGDFIEVLRIEFTRLAAIADAVDASITQAREG